MDKLSLAQALMKGFETIAIGLITVFSVLIILMVVLILMKYIFAEKNKQEDAIESVVKESDDSLNEETEEELIAILTAAVAASLNTSTYNLKIKSYRRIGNNAPAWNKAGLTDIINSRY